MDLITETPAHAEFASSESLTVLRGRPGRQGLLIAHFPPQHIGEPAFYDAEDSDSPPGKGKPADGPTPSSAPEPPDLPPVQARFAGPSRLVFEVPADHPPIEY